MIGLRSKRFKALLGVTAVALIGVTLAGCSSSGSKKSTDKSSNTTSSKTTSSRARTVHLTFMGDDTLGTDPNLNSATSLPTVWAQHGDNPHYFFQNVQKYFKSDDLTIANLETTFATTAQMAPKAGNVVFHFKGNPKLANVLKVSGIDAVTVSNNHIYDYGKQGFKQTIKAVKAAGVGYFGEGYKYVKTVKGVKFGFLGYTGWTATASDKAKIARDIKSLRKQGCQVVIPYFHWGIERQAKPNATQVTLAHYAINHGADMVIGSHPHVIETMELYKGKLIAYSMGNFCFGGNPNPVDKRSFLLQTNLTVKNKKITNSTFRVIPTRISTTDAKNDYVPTPYTGSEKQEVLKYMNQLSPTFKGRIADRFNKIE